jgi:hypothetical protein
MSDDDKPIDALDAMYADLALHQAKYGVPTEADRMWAACLRLKAKLRIAECRRGLVSAAVLDATVPAIRPELLAMKRAELLALLDDIAARRDVQLFPRRLHKLSDDDLRRLLETLDPERSPS